MSEDLKSPTATIYQFPTRLRSNAAALPKDGATITGDPWQPNCDFSSAGWYHEAAIRESDLGRNR